MDGNSGQELVGTFRQLSKLQGLVLNYSDNMLGLGLFLFGSCVRLACLIEVMEI